MSSLELEWSPLEAEAESDGGPSGSLWGSLFGGLITDPNHHQALRALFPVGRFWQWHPDSRITKLADALSLELQWISTRAQKLLNEADPRTCEETIGQWESMLSLPDVEPVPHLLGDRRAAVHARLIAVPGQDLASWQEVASALGYTIQIHRLNDPFLATSECTHDCQEWGSDWAWAWQITTPSQGETRDALLKERITAAAHLYTKPVFVFT